MQACTYLLLCLWLLSPGTEAESEDRRNQPKGLSLEKKCGDINCQLHQYCSDLLCHNCSIICLKDNHNFDATTCENECQDYIHDSIKHYLTADSNLEEKIESLRNLTAGSLIFSGVLAVILFVLIGFLFLKFRRQNKDQQIEKELGNKLSTVSVIYNNNDDKDKPLTLDIPKHSIAPSLATTTTPISTRHPSEDATLEDVGLNFAYDNPNLTPSPILGNQDRSTTF